VYQLAGMGEVAQDLAKSLLTNPEKNITLQRALEFARRYVDVDQYLTPGSIKSMLSSMSQPVLKGTLRFLGGTLGVVGNIFLVLFISFYLFRDGEAIMRNLVNLFPLERRRAEDLIARTRTIISASVNGVLVIAALQGALGGLMFWILGLPSPLVWGVVMSVLAMLPVGGTGIIWLPAALILIFTGHWVKGVILIAFGALIIGTIDNILRPRLVGGKTGMHDLTIFFSVLGGLKVFGLVGFLLGPVMLAITFALLSIYRKEESEEAG
jgi:predicted PurR-regulated permease PerM